MQVTSEADVNKALDIVKDKFKRLDNLVNCAGQSTTHQIYNFHSDKYCDLEHFTKCVNVSMLLVIVSPTCTVNKLQTLNRDDNIFFFSVSVL